VVVAEAHVRPWSLSNAEQFGGSRSQLHRLMKL